MLCRNSYHSCIQGELLPLIKAEVLPKIKYVETHSLLRRSAPHINSLGALAAVQDKPKRSPLDFPSEELYENEAQEDDVDTGPEEVKKLDSWIYARGLHKKHDNDFRKTLRKTTVKKVAAIRLDAYMDDHDSYIIRVASHLLKGEHMMDSEAMSERTSRLNSKVATKVSDGYLNAPYTYQTSQFKPIKAAQSQSTGNSLDSEIRAELQALTYRKYLKEKKDYLHKLIAENDGLVQEIKAMRIVLLHNTIETEQAEGQEEASRRKRLGQGRSGQFAVGSQSQ
eukprot:TRINITY_DN3934_c0_g1_i1.p1 TRINITY_DN3934_c0_g1~~TRINITY_DN3934_c0_g1_i1.p1  ORF type:complete len:281 (+),score=71.79 TRINITY_DN3934_c0_g1_i1:137-979(+)